MLSFTYLVLNCSKSIFLVVNKIYNGQIKRSWRRATSVTLVGSIPSRGVNFLVLITGKARR